MARWLVRVAADAVGRLNAIVEQDADPAALLPSPRRARRRSNRPTGAEPVPASACGPGGPAEAPPIGPAGKADRGQQKERPVEPDRTATAAQVELAAIMAAQQRRMRGGRRSDPPR